MDTNTLLVGLSTLILGGGFVGGIVALVKLKPEGDQILVNSAKDVVLIQAGALDNLRREREEDRKRIDEIEARFAERLDKAEQARWTAETALAECHRTRQALAAELEEEKARNALLVERLEALEAEVAALRAATSHTPDSRTRSTDHKETP